MGFFFYRSESWQAIRVMLIVDSWPAFHAFALSVVFGVSFFNIIYIFLYFVFMHFRCVASPFVVALLVAGHIDRIDSTWQTQRNGSQWVKRWGLKARSPGAGFIISRYRIEYDSLNMLMNKFIILCTKIIQNISCAEERWRYIAL